MALTRSAGRAPAGGHARQARHPRQSTRYPVSYRSETSSIDGSDESEEDVINSSDSESEEFDVVSVRSRPSHRGPVPQPKNRTSRNNNGMANRNTTRSQSSGQRSAAAAGGKRHQTREKGAPSTSSISPAKRRQKAYEKAIDAASQGATNVVIPNWLDPRISYGCWVAIFGHAASEQNTESHTSWLLNTALVCRAFAEPALKALYSCPMIRTPTKAKRLASLLGRESSETYTNYRAKIEYLHIDIHIVPQTLLYSLIHPLTRLKELIIYTTVDQLPYRKLEPYGRWHYPESLFKALLSSSEPSDVSVDKTWPTALKSWEWSGRLMGGHVATVNDITRIHKTPSFAHLTRVSFTNFQIPSYRYLTSDDNLEDGLFVEGVAQAISELKSLQHLAFESSSVVNKRLLSLLSHDLTSLDLINCWDITSEHLRDYLQKRGRGLLSLTLLHNQSLNLEFLTDLASSCPNLRYLDMNMSYFRYHGSINDANPLYDVVLLPSQRPQWPSTLRVLSIEHIRYWHEETAEMFLQSVAESSATLTDLRYLSIKTMLDIPWQARAKLRKKWRIEMDRIFLRPFIPPKEHTSLRQGDASEPGQTSQKRKRRNAGRAVSPSRRSGRIAESQSERFQGLRTARQRKLMYREPDTDEDEFDGSSDEGEGPMTEDVCPNKRSRNVDSADADADDSTHPMVQGLCETVTILFDNQKLTEVQFGMDDFIGGEESEEEWDGMDSEEDLSIAF